MIKIQNKQGVYGKVKVVEGYKDYPRLYVKRTNIKTYIVSQTQVTNLDSMVKVNGEYHFSTLKELTQALNA